MSEHDDETPEPTRLVLGSTRDRSTRDRSNDVVMVELDDDVLEARRPKLAVLVRLATVLEDETADPIAQVGAFNELLSKILAPESYELIQDRLDDEDDDLDLDHEAIQQLFEQLLGLWYDRPTGRPRGSSGSRRRTGRASTAASRSRG